MYSADVIAGFLGPLYLAVGVGLLANPEYYQKVMKDFFKQEGLLYVSGLIALFFGLIILYMHGGWPRNWSVLITLLGWAAFLKGISILAAPKWFIGQFKSWNMAKLVQTGGWIAIGLGAIFTYMAYIA